MRYTLLPAYYCIYIMFSAILRKKIDFQDQTNFIKAMRPWVGFEPPSFRLTAERANQLRHRDGNCSKWEWPWIKFFWMFDNILFRFKQHLTIPVWKNYKTFS